MRVVCFEDKYAIGNEGNMVGNTKPKGKEKRISCLPCRRQDVAVAPPVHVYVPLLHGILVSLFFSPQPPPTFY